VSRTTKTELAEIEAVEPLIREIRVERVILDADLARLYGVRTKALDQAVKRNGDRFPRDFLFRPTHLESQTVNRSQTVTRSHKHRSPRLRPFAFTEHGAIMAATILNSPRAVEMSLYVIRAFIKMRAALAGQTDLARRLAEIEKALIGHDAAQRDLYR